MANPINKQYAALPAGSAPLVDANGIATPEYYYFFLALWSRTGGPMGIVDDATGIANAALAKANEAFALATLARAEAHAAQTTATLAANAAATAQQEIDAMSPLAYGSLQKTQNLGDLTNPQTARGNLGLAGVRFVFFFPSLTGQTIYQPISDPVGIPSGLTRTETYCGTPPSSDATFTLKKIAAGSGAVTIIGNITLTAGSYAAATLSAAATVALQLGDTLQIDAPVSDGHNVAISVRGFV